MNDKPAPANREASHINPELEHAIGDMCSAIEVMDHYLLDDGLSEEEKAKHRYWLITTALAQAQRLQRIFYNEEARS